MAWLVDSDPFVIAINGLSFISVPDGSWPRIVRALFGLAIACSIDVVLVAQLEDGYTVEEI